MFDKQKIIDMTAKLQEFFLTHTEIFVFPEVLSINVLSLLKRFNVKIMGILANSTVESQQIFQTPQGNYPILNLSVAIQHFNNNTGIIISSFKQAPSQIFNATFDLGSMKIEIPTFYLTNEEARAIYDRLTILQTLKQYREDGLIVQTLKDVCIGFGRGMSTFIDSRYQDIKFQVWDRREFEIPTYDVEDTAIVIQGPIQYLDNYTITTAQLYRQWYPKASIVISTWKNQATKPFIKACKKIGVTVLENDLVTAVGYTTNLQLESSLRGVEYVKRNTSAKYTLKCRTDQRINRTDFIIYFKNLLNAFPPNGQKLRQRLIFFGASKLAPFAVCDFLYFGTTEDVIKIFDIPKQTENGGRYAKRLEQRMQRIGMKLTKCTLLPVLNIKNNRKLEKYNILQNKWDAPERYILKTFYATHIDTIDPSKFSQTYWKFLRDYAVVIAQRDAILDWPKYTNDWYGGMYSFNSAYLADFYYDLRGIEFSEWLNIYLNYKDD